VITTARLVLAPHRADDLDDSAAMWADPEVVRFIGGRPLAREEAWTRLLRNVGQWSLVGYGYWVARDRDGRFVGEIGFGDFRRALDPPLLDAPEVGWVLARHAHGRGIATEAVRAVLAWGDARFARTQCIIDPDHAASIRVATKCGFVEIARATYRDAPTVVLERTRPPAPA
jgi:RimJ/RimL family protein N-acetyltransferase